MRTLSEAGLLVATSPGRSARLRVDVMRGADRVLDGIMDGGLTGVAPRLSWDLDGEIKQVADFEVVYASDFGDSLTPRAFQSALGPWGNDVQLSMEFSLGSQMVTVPVGRLMIDKNPSATDGTGIYRLMGRDIVIGSHVTVSAKSLDERVARAGFGAEKLAPVEATCWGEIARLTGMKVARNVPDVASPGLEYERSQRDRLKQVQALGRALGGAVVVDATGTLRVVPTEILTPVGVLDATPIEAPYEVDSEGVYNEVVGNFEDADRNPIVVPPAQITVGPLAVDGPYGRYTRYYASPFVTTGDAAVSAIAKLLADVSRPTFERKFGMLLDPRVEIGDTWTIAGTTGLVTALEWRDDQMTVTLQYRGDVRA